MDHADIALKLLTTANDATARQLAESLNELNDQRQKKERLILDGILSDFASHPDRLERKALVCWHPEWHPGVLGIVASRLTERYFRPAVLIAAKDELGKGSARSIPGVDLFKALHACRHCLHDFGGHSMAAGLTIRTRNLAEFQHAFEKTVAEMTRPDDSIPQLTIDAEVKFADISEVLINEIEALSPFGIANPEPLLMARDVKVVSSKILGRNHRKMMLAQDADRRQKPFPAIRFNADGRMLTEMAFSRVAFRLRWNRWNSNKSIQLIVEDAE
jgi:single-stranded-DNA-specific exonuclease